MLGLVKGDWVNSEVYNTFVVCGETSRPLNEDIEILEEFTEDQYFFDSSAPKYSASVQNIQPQCWRSKQSVGS